MSGIRINVLGPLDVRDGDLPVAVGGARPRALLTILASAAPGTVSTERLVDLLWDEPPANPANALQALVSRLRRALGEHIRFRDGSYGLTGTDTDLALFARLREESSRESEPGRRGDLLREALDLWRGPALADAPDATAERARLDETRLTTVEAYAHARLDAGRAAETVALLAAEVAARPRHEALRALHIRALHAVGRQAEALSGYEEIRRLLAEELGADPGPELASAHLAVLRSPAPEDAPGGNLPHPLTSFVGREADAAAVAALLESSRLVTLLGPGGAGKTRLAVEVGRAGAWPAGAWLAELAPLTDPADVVRTVARVLSVREPRGLGALPYEPAPEAAERVDRIVAAVGARRMLLILDNCEHLVDAAAALSARLLEGCPGLTILATSREPLGITGEALRPVPPLALPDETAEPDEVLRSPAIRLLLDRAATAAPAVRLGGADAPALAHIAHRLDGAPLAIELAAARLRTLSPAALAERLDDRFGLLTGGSRTALPRHQTLHAVVDWSWELLTDAERAFARRFAVFAGDADLAAVEAVCGPEALAHLGSLIDKSFVERSGEDRYRMLETIRAYAAGRLADGDGERRARDDHAAYYLELALAGEIGLHHPDQLLWLRRFTVENENLTAALRHLISTRQVADALRMCSAMCQRWWLLYHQETSAAWSRRVVALVDGTPPPGTAGQYAMCFFTAHFATWMPSLFGDSSSIADELTGFLRLVDTAEAEGTAPIAVLAFGVVVCMLSGRLDDMRARLARYLASDDPWLVSSARMASGYLALNGGDLPGAITHFEATVTALREQGDRFNLGSIALSLADLYIHTGRPEAAASLMAEVDAVAAELSGYVEAVDIHLWLARLRLALGDVAGAEAAADMVRGRLDTASPASRLHARLIFATLQRVQGDHAAAVAAATEVIEELPHEGDTQTMVCWAYAVRGRTRVLSGDHEGGVRDHVRALRLLHVHPATRTHIVPLIMDGFALAARAAGDARRSAWLLGVSVGFNGGPGRDREVGALLPVLRGALGDAGFEEAFAAGQAAVPAGALSLDREEIIALVGSDPAAVGAQGERCEHHDQTGGPARDPQQLGPEAGGVGTAQHHGP